MVLGVVVGLVQAIALLVQIIATGGECRQARCSGTLLAKIESVPWLPNRVDIFCTDIATIEEKYPNTLVPRALQRVLDGLEVRLNELERGHLYVDSYDPGLKLELMKQSPSILRTTSLQPRTWSGIARMSGAVTGRCSSMPSRAAGRSSATSSTTPGRPIWIHWPVSTSPPAYA